MRRWCKALEDAGYIFGREQNRRVFGQRDAVVLQLVKEQMASPGTGTTLEEACKAAVQIQADQGQIEQGTEDTLSADKQFEELLEGLADRIYWSGAEVAVMELRTAYQRWKAVKEGKGHEQNQDFEVHGRRS